MTENNEIVRPVGVLGAAKLLQFIGWVTAILGPIGGIIIAFQKVEDCSGYYCEEKYSSGLIGAGIGSGVSALAFGCLFIAVGGYIGAVVSKWKAPEFVEEGLPSSNSQYNDPNRF